MRTRIIAGAALLAAAAPLAAQTNVVSGTGEAPITKDVDSVRAMAEAEAKRALVIQLLKQAIGADRAGGISSATIDSLAGQIRADMIVRRSATREGKTYIVTLEANVDRSWFMGQIDNEGIDSSVFAAGGENQLIFVMIDQTGGPGRDYSQPQEIVTEYDRSTGSSYSDTSASAYSEKERSGSTYRGSSASRMSGSVAVGVSDGYGSAAGRSRVNSASGSSVKAASASSHTINAVDKTNIQAREHDDERYRQRISYQKTAQPAVGAALDSMTAALENHGVQLAIPHQHLASYFAGKPPRFDELKSSPRFPGFLRMLSQNKAPFFMGGTMSIQDTGRDTATGLFRCSGQLNASAFATVDRRSVASGSVSATDTGASAEDCEGKVAGTLARLASNEIGPKVQNYWRRQMKERGETVQASQAGGVYTLTVRAAQLDMAVQADLLDALMSTPGVEGQAFIEQVGNQMTFEVTYSGEIPLQLALFQKLRGNPAFAGMKPTSEGRSVILCLSACGQ